MCALLLYFLDSLKGGILGVSKKKRQEIQEIQKLRSDESS